MRTQRFNTETAESTEVTETDPVRLGSDREDHWPRHQGASPPRSRVGRKRLYYTNLQNDRISAVIPAKAGIHAEPRIPRRYMDSCFRRNDAGSVSLFAAWYNMEFLCWEFRNAGPSHAREVPLTVVYENMRLPSAYRADGIVAGGTILEVKSIERLLPAHEAQLLACPRLSDCKVGLLTNFNSTVLTDSLRRFVA